jgi:starch phosphorylase
MDKKDIKLAYFSAEIGLKPEIKTYSGGLGILAGDTIKAMADLEVPICAVTLLYQYGYFKQKIEDNNQTESQDYWDYKNLLEDTGKSVHVNIRGEDIKIRIWKYVHEGITGHKIPIFFLGTHMDENPKWAHELTDHLYVGDRLAQEIVLGIGGIRALKELGYSNLDKYHMNEGHSALLTLELYKTLGETLGWDDSFVKEKCSFTTHTPIPAGHDKFTYEELYHDLKGEKDIIPLHIKKLAGEDMLNMTKLAMSFSDYVNGVSRKHAEVTRTMFPDQTIDYITNGIHTSTWVCKHFAELYDKYIPGWKKDFSKLGEVKKIPGYEIYETHQKAKKDLIEYVNTHSIIKENEFDTEKITIGFARRFIAYKDAEMIFSNIDKLKHMGKKVQFVFAGKAHKRDGIGKNIIRRVIEKAQMLKKSVNIAFLENYDMDVSKLMISGCDLWLNTPIPFNEASGTSGMKAAANGCLHFSRLDGWAIEAYERNGGGFPITEYNDFATTMFYKIIPMYYDEDKTSWINEMKLAIGNSASYFNTHRMAKEYLEKVYLYRLK